MKWRLWILMMVSFCALPLSMFAQSENDTTRNDYALLWEITGNDLNEPSYLFGSMHVRYNAVFEFPDSLYICLQACDAIANEVHLDSAMQRFYEVYYGREELVVDSLYKQIATNKSAKTDSLDQLYETENPPEDFDIREFFKGLVRLDDIEERGFQRTMLDAQLMETARSWGMERYGLEKIDEHMYEPEYSSDPPTPLKSFLFGNSISTLLDIYYQGDIESVEKFMRASPGAVNQLALIPRNYIMCNSMERIMKEENKSLFTVVGAAHLPGNEGVIQLLRERGYHLRKVETTFTGLRDSFLIENHPRIWNKTTSDDQTFTYALPWDFNYQQIDGTANSYYAFDIGQGLNYLIMKTALLPDSHEDLEEWFFGDDGYTVDSKEEIEHKGLKGHQYELTRSGSEPEYFRGYTFIVDQELYYLQIGAYEQTELDVNTNVDSFLQQFEVIKINNNKWVTVNDTIGGFTVKLPNNYSYSRAYLNDTYYNNKLEDYPHHIYRAGFSDEKASVWVQYYDQQAGSEPLGAVERLGKVKDELTSLYGLEFEVAKKDSLDGFPYWDLEALYSEENIVVNIKMLVRGSRLYLISRLDKPSGKLTKKFLPSFKLLPLRKEELQTYSFLPKAQLSSQLPVNYTENEIDLSFGENWLPVHQIQITAQDEAAGASYRMDILELPSLFGSSDTTKVFDYFLRGFLMELDSVYERKTVVVQDKYPGLEIYCSSPNNEVDQLILVYVAGKYLIRKKIYGDTSYLKSLNAQHFFYNDKWSPSIITTNTLADRSDELILQLATNDSLKITKAFRAFNSELSVNTDNAQAFSNLLLNNHWEETHADPDELRLLIIKGIRLGVEEPTSVISALFNNAKANSDLRYAILTDLGFEMENNRDLKELYFSLLQSDKALSARSEETVFFPYLFNQQLFLEDWSLFESLLTDQQEPLFVWEKAAEILSVDSLNHEPIVTAVQSFEQRAIERLESNSLSIAEINTILSLFEHLPPSQKLKDQVDRIFELDEISEATVLAAGYLLSQGETIPKSKIKQIIAKDSLRVKMIRILNQHKQMKLLPKNSYNQLQVARSLFLEKVQLDEIGEASMVEFLDTQEVLFKGEPKLVFVFSFNLEEDENLLGVAGFFSTNRKEKAFEDEHWVNYTLYTIPSRSRGDKVTQLVKELESGPIDFNFDFDFDY